MNKKHYLPIFFALILAINTIFLVWYIFEGYKGTFHSDSAAKVLLAKEIYDTRSFFPAKWNYVNGDLFVVFGHLPIVPLLEIIPPGFKAHAISGLLFAGLILYSIWLVTSLTEAPIWQRLAVTAVFASGLSGFMAENLFGQVSYGIVVLFSCYLIFSTWKFIHSKNKRLWGFTLFLIATVIFWQNPKRALIAYSFPLFFATSTLIIDARDGEARKVFQLLAIFIIGSTLGAILYHFTITGVHNVSGAANAKWLSFDQITTNIVPTLKGIFAQLGGLTQSDSSIFSPAAMYSGVRFAAACITLFLAPYCLSRAIKSNTQGHKLLAAYSITVLFTSLFLQVSTSIPDMNDPIQSSRYLVPGVVLCTIVILTTRLDIKAATIQSIALVFVVTIFVTSAASSFLYTDSNSQRTLRQPGKVDMNRQELVKLLQEHSLEYGYATYWNAGSISVLSEGKTVIRQINIANGLPMPMRHLSSDRWYKPSYWNGKTFLLLTKDEAKIIEWEKLKRQGLVPSMEIRNKNYVIAIFEENIANKLPGWDTTYQTTAKFLPSASTLRRVGNLVLDGTQFILIAEKGRRGALHYGPYIQIEPGRYRATFDVIAKHNPRGSVELDVASDYGKNILGKLLLTESANQQEIDFDVQQHSTIELRVWVLGNEAVALRSISLSQRNPPSFQ